MIRKPSVLILGSGASAHLAYPSNADLRQRIIEGLNQESSSPFRQLITLGFSKEDVNDFVSRFRHSGRDSIDAFLEYQDENIKKIGRCAIAQTLILLEHLDALFPIKSDKIENNWYYYLFKSMSSSFDSFHENQISFITFNYDRSLEHFLFTSLKENYRKSDKETAKKLAEIKIIHVHGVLGNLLWQSKEGRGYKSSCTNDELQKSAERIRIISDGISNPQFLSEAWNKLRAAELICCLGFGYDPINMDRLKLNELTQKKVDFQGTSYGLGNAQQSKVLEYFSNGRYCIKLHDSKGDITHFLKEKVLFK